MPDPIAFIASLPERSNTTALSLDREGAATLRLDMDATQAHLLTANWARLMDQALYVVIVPESENVAPKRKRQKIDT